MKIRTAELSDLSGMCVVGGLDCDEDTRKRIINEWIVAEEAVVAVIDDTVVGYAVLNYSFFGNGFISLLTVRKESRRMGVATALLIGIEKNCTTEKLFTSTNRSNKPMQALLETLSYVESGTVYNLDDGDPELFYFKRLKGTQ